MCVCTYMHIRCWYTLCVYSCTYKRTCKDALAIDTYRYILEHLLLMCVCVYIHTHTQCMYPFTYKHTCRDAETMNAY